MYRWRYLGPIGSIARGKRPWRLIYFRIHPHTVPKNISCQDFIPKRLTHTRLSQNRDVTLEIYAYHSTGKERTNGANQSRFSTFWKESAYSCVPHSETALCYFPIFQSRQRRQPYSPYLWKALASNSNRQL